MKYVDKGGKVFSKFTWERSVITHRVNGIPRYGKPEKVFVLVFENDRREEVSASLYNQAQVGQEVEYQMLVLENWEKIPWVLVGIAIFLIVVLTIYLAYMRFAY